MAKKCVDEVATVEETQMVPESKQWVEQYGRVICAECDTLDVMRAISVASSTSEDGLAPNVTTLFQCMQCHSVTTITIQLPTFCLS